MHAPCSSCPNRLTLTGYLKFQELPGRAHLPAYCIAPYAALPPRALSAQLKHLVEHTRPQVMEPCKTSDKIFSRSNPWVAAILALAAEIYTSDAIKLNLKFDVEMLFRHFSLQVELGTWSLTCTLAPLRSTQTCPCPQSAHLPALSASGCMQPALHPAAGYAGGQAWSSALRPVAADLGADLHRCKT